MVTMPVKSPTESSLPQRRTPMRGAGVPYHRRGGDEPYGSLGSEAMSRNEFVPVANVLRDNSTVTVESAASPVIRGHNPSPAPTARDFPSPSESFSPERPLADESVCGSEYPVPAFSHRGSYSVYSDEPRSKNHLGTPDWKKHDVPSFLHTQSSAGHGGAEARPWTGQGQGLHDDGESPRSNSTEDSTNSSRWTFKTNDERAPRRPQHNTRGVTPLHEPPRDVLLAQESNRSCMSHDLSGFSDFDSQPTAHLIGNSQDFEDHPYESTLGTGAAVVAAAAEATNAAASKLTMQKGTRKEREYPAPKVPNPHPSVRDEKKTKKDSSRSRFDGMQASSSNGRRDGSESRREEPAQSQSTAPTSRGEYAVVRYRAVIFTPAMFVLCGCLLFYEFSLNDWEAESLAENPSYGPSVEVLLEAGAKRTDLIVDNDDWWRLFTPMFLHAGVVHFLFNMIGFMQVGAMVERVFGWWKVASIYLVAGVFGTIVSAIFVPTQVMVGASGAIFGVFGALWADLWQNWSVYAEKLWSLTVLFVLTVVNVLFGLMPYLDNFAHIGGIVMGFLMGLGLLVQKREDDFGSRLDKKCYQRTLQLVSVIGVPTMILLGLSLLYGRSDPDEWCGWCENISCVEFPPGDNPWWACDECSVVGFEASFLEDGTYEITCPDLSVVSQASCAGTTSSELLDCCIDVCL